MPEVFRISWSSHLWTSLGFLAVGTAIPWHLASSGQLTIGSAIFFGIWIILVIWGMIAKPMKITFDGAGKITFKTLFRTKIFSETAVQSVLLKQAWKRDDFLVVKIQNQEIQIPSDIQRRDELMARFQSLIKNTSQRP